MSRRTAAAFAAAVFFSVLLLGGCGKAGGGDTSAAFGESGTLPQNTAALPASSVPGADTASGTKQGGGDASTGTAGNTAGKADATGESSTVKPDVTKPSQDADSSRYSRSGVMAFSENPSNKYLAAVAEKYSLSSETLVALYTIPDADDNLVLEFDGSRDSAGKCIRNEDTLIAIYSIKADLTSKCASEDSARNEYSYGEMKVMFLTANKYIIPKFRAELDG